MSEFYVYMLECADGTFYTGQTNNLQRRIREHQGGRGAMYTQARRPVVLVYVEECASREEAYGREHKIKQMSHDRKAELAAAWPEETDA